MTDNTSMTQADLAGLVGSRLCHDLVSPLGAIGNGIELLSLSPGMAAVTASPEMALINDALAAARAHQPVPAGFWAIGGRPAHRSGRAGAQL